jgi:predicted regulator of Ras-like GTPase activity (Roadblock/LC7/MglB family)
MTEPSARERSLGWLVDSFVHRVPGVKHAVVVSSDGLVIAWSENLARDEADRFAAVASGLIGLAHGASGRFGGGRVNEVIVEMEHAFLFVSGISDGSSLAVMAEEDCDVGLVGYEMAVLGDQTGAVLTPELRDSLRGTGVR